MPQYGGTERIVSYLTEELSRAGHEVTLFASGDSLTAATLVGTSPISLREAGVQDATVHHTLQLEKVYRSAPQFDVIHFHTDHLHFSWARRFPTAQVTTLHGRLDLPDLVPLYEEFADMPVSSISDSQRAPLPHLNWRGTVLHGLPKNLYRFTERPSGYLAFLGRVSPEKGLDRAIAIARQSGKRLRVAAKVDTHDLEYFEKELRPLIAHCPHVEFIGEIGEAEKSEFLGNADALLFPINWPEPFGLVMIEAMACGTPVIAFRAGSVPEVIEPGSNGFIVDSIQEAAEAVGTIDRVSRRECRAIFERRFSVSRMASEYLRMYESLIRNRTPRILSREWFLRGASGRTVSQRHEVRQA